MSAHHESRSERYLRFSRGGMVMMLGLVLVVGALGLAMTLRPENGARWMAQAGWMLPIAIAIAAGILQRITLRGERWRPESPEARAILEDEWRRASMDRALRLAFVVVLVAQVPLGLALAHLPTWRAVMAMAIGTSVLGMATLLTLSLFFGREAGDEH